ncbi:MAG: hypothetical protein QXJ68_04130 [Methanocellales archaeon]
MARKNVAIKENLTWKNVKRKFKVNEKWNSIRAERGNKIWNDVKSGMDSYKYEARKVWDEVKAEEKRRKNRVTQGYLLLEV